MYRVSPFYRFVRWTAHAAGHPAAFVFAVAVVLGGAWDSGVSRSLCYISGGKRSRGMFADTRWHVEADYLPSR